MYIEVFRPKQSYDVAKEYTLFADGEQVAVIKSGEKQLIHIPEKHKHCRLD